MLQRDVERNGLPHAVLLYVPHLRLFVPVIACEVLSGVAGEHEPVENFCKDKRALVVQVNTPRQNEDVAQHQTCQEVTWFLYDTPVTGLLQIVQMILHDNDQHGVPYAHKSHINIRRTQPILEVRLTSHEELRLHPEDFAVQVDGITMRAVLFLHSHVGRVNHHNWPVQSWYLLLNAKGALRPGVHRMDPISHVAVFGVR